MVWGLYEEDEKLRSVFLRVNKIGVKTFALSGRNKVLSSRVLTELVDRQFGRSDAAARSTPIDDLVDQAVATAMDVVNGRLDPERIKARERRAACQPARRTAADHGKVRAQAARAEPRAGPRATGSAAGPGTARTRSASCTSWSCATASRSSSYRPTSSTGRSRTSRVVGAHAFRIPVLPEFLAGGNVQLRVWEARGTRLPRASLRRRGQVPRLRRVREDRQPAGRRSRRYPPPAAPRGPNAGGAVKA